MGWTCWAQGVVENKDETDHETWQQGNPWNLWKNSFFYRNLLIFVLCSSKTQSREFSRTPVSRRNPGLRCEENQSLSWAHWLSESSHVAVVVPSLGSSRMTGPVLHQHIDSASCLDSGVWISVLFSILAFSVWCLCLRFTSCLGCPDPQHRAPAFLF